MAIHGTVILEDQTIQFTAHEQLPTVSYCVILSDSVTAQTEERTVPARAFFIALALAIHHDGDFPQDSEEHAEQWALAESAQPINPALRFIP